MRRSWQRTLLLNVSAGLLVFGNDLRASEETGEPTLMRGRKRKKEGLPTNGPIQYHDKLQDPDG